MADRVQHRNTGTHPSLFKWKQLTYISCTTDTVHSNELALHRIHDSMHFFVPLPHKQLAHFFSFFFPDRRALCNLLRAGTEYKP